MPMKQLSTRDHMTQRLTTIACIVHCVSKKNTSTQDTLKHFVIKL